MASLLGKLNAFLDKSARKATAWGDFDCMLEIADWLDQSCGLKSAEAWRGRYASEEEAYALLDPLGGFETAIRGEMARLGLAEAVQPEFGDVALVTLGEEPKPMGAILMPSGKWRIRTLTGFAVTRAVTVIVAWSLPCRATGA